MEQVGRRRKYDHEAVMKLVREGKNDIDISRTLGINKNTVRYIRTHSDEWNARECEYLSEQYGVLSDREIAEKLNRKVSAIREKAKELHLGSKLDNADGVTVSYIAGILWGEQTDVYQEKLLNMGIPHNLVSYGKDEHYYIVNIDKFFVWAKKHKDELSFLKFERFTLGKEPKWVDEKRRADWQEYTHQRWAAYA